MNKRLVLDDGDVPSIGCFYCYADKHKIGQVFRNLFSNALKFTREGGRVLAVAKALIPLDGAVGGGGGLSARVSARRAAGGARGGNSIRSIRNGGGRGLTVALEGGGFLPTHTLRINVVDDGVGLSKVGHVN